MTDALSVMVEYKLTHLEQKLVARSALSVPQLMTEYAQSTHQSVLSMPQLVRE